MNTREAHVPGQGKGMGKTEQMYEKFVDEYGSKDAVRKYTSGPAGFAGEY
jgi:hypothetical protein